MNITEVNKQLQELRVKWRENPSKRPIYELKARALKAAIRIYYKVHPEEYDRQTKT